MRSGRRHPSLLVLILLALGVLPSWAQAQSTSRPSPQWGDLRRCAECGRHLSDPNHSATCPGASAGRPGTDGPDTGASADSPAVAGDGGTNAVPYADLGDGPEASTAGGASEASPAFGSGAASAPGLGGFASSGGGALNMLGDQGVVIITPNGPRLTSGFEELGVAVSIQRAFALNITDNNSALLQNRIIPIEFNYFDRSNRAFPGLIARPDRFADQVAPSLQSRTRVQTRDYRYTFGMEYRFADRWSILVRQAVVGMQQPSLILQRGRQLHQLGHFSYGWSDLQISPKYLIYGSDRFVATFSLGSVIPIGQNGPYHQFGNAAFVIQPTLLVYTRPTDRLYLQGALEYDVPIAGGVEGVTLFRYVVSGAYQIAGDPSNAFLKGLFPIMELHGDHLVGGFQQNVLNLTTGFRANVFERTQFGVAYAFPLTQDYQFRNEIMASVNIFF